MLSPVHMIFYTLPLIKIFHDDFKKKRRNYKYTKNKEKPLSQTSITVLEINFQEYYCKVKKQRPSWRVSTYTHSSRTPYFTLFFSSFLLILPSSGPRWSLNKPRRRWGGGTRPGSRAPWCLCGAFPQQRHSLGSQAGDMQMWSGGSISGSKLWSPYEPTQRTKKSLPVSLWILGCPACPQLEAFLGHLFSACPSAWNLLQPRWMCARSSWLAPLVEKCCDFKTTAN